MAITHTYIGLGILAGCHKTIVVDGLGNGRGTTPFQRGTGVDTPLEDTKHKRGLRHNLAYIRSTMTEKGDFAKRLYVHMQESKQYKLGEYRKRDSKRPPGSPYHHRARKG